MANPTRFDRIIASIKDHRWLSVLIVAGAVFLAIASIAKGIQEVGALFGKSFSTNSQNVRYDATTREAIIAVARDVDHFLLVFETSPDRIEFNSMRPDYIKIMAELRSIMLRAQARPHGVEGTLVAVNAVQTWSKVPEVLKDPQSQPTSAGIMRGVMSRHFRAALIIDSASADTQK